MKTEKEKVAQDFLRWCARQRWDLLFALPFPEGKTVAETFRNFRRWILEIEMAEGTLAFRWVRMVKVHKTEPLGDFYVLVGGLSSGEWWYWARRWRVLSGGTEGAGVHYWHRLQRRGRGRRSVGPVLRELLAGENFDFDLRIGPQVIQRQRRMKRLEDW